jgi:hypothetical protein
VKAVIGKFLIKRGVDWGRCRVFVDEVKVAGSVYSLDRVDPLKRIWTMRTTCVTRVTEKSVTG